MDNKKKEVKKLIINKDSHESDSDFSKNLENYIDTKKSQNKALKKIIENLTENKNK